MTQSVRRNDLFNNEKVKNYIHSKLEKTKLKIIKASKELIDEGYLEINRGYLALTRKGIVISNTIIVRLFERLRLD